VGYVLVRYFHLHGLKVAKTRQFFPYWLKNPYPKQKKMARALVIT
jgi:hypothetical protein